MSTVSELPENVYEVRGRRVQINYDEDEHTVTFHSPDIGQLFDNTTNPQRQLEDLGIYTRVQAVTNTGRNLITVKLKPAASVELRASPDEGTKLEARPVSKQFDGSTISKRRGKYGYQATCGTDLLADLYDLETEEELEGTAGQAAVYAELNGDQLALRVEPTETPHSMTARIDSTGLIGLPNGLGAAANLDGHGINWEVVDSGDALLGTTTFEPAEAEMPESIDDPQAHPEDKHFHSSISFVRQDVERNGKEWTQTHFTAYIPSGIMNYLTSEDVEPAQWGANGRFPAKWTEEPTREQVVASYVDIHLVNVDGELMLQFRNDVRPRYVDDVTIEQDTVPEDADDPTITYDMDGNKIEKGPGESYYATSASTAPCVRRIHQNSGNNQVTFSFPHSLAYALRLDPDDEGANSRDVRWGIDSNEDEVEATDADAEAEDLDLCYWILGQPLGSE